MRKLFVVFVLATACYACGGGASDTKPPVSNNEANSNSQIGGDSTAPATSSDADNTKTPATDTAAAAAPATATAAVGDGKALIAKSDCLTCHQEATKVIGPSYKEVAKKYEATDANVKLLAGKIIAGGKGVWGELPMTAHPQLSPADAETMVRYILSLK
jgi:cytochrome c